MGGGGEGREGECGDVGAWEYGEVGPWKFSMIWYVNIGWTSQYANSVHIRVKLPGADMVSVVPGNPAG